MADLKNGKSIRFVNFVIVNSGDNSDQKYHHLIAVVAVAIGVIDAIVAFCGIIDTGVIVTICVLSPLASLVALSTLSPLTSLA